MEITKILFDRQRDPHGKKSATMCFLGDSVTHGCYELRRIPNGGYDTVYDYDSAYCKKVEKIIKTAYPSAQLNVINSGISGDSAPGGLARLERDVLSFSPDFVSVCYGLNDCMKGKGGIEEYLTALDIIFKKLKSAGVKDVVFLTPNMMNTYVSADISDPIFIDCAKATLEIQNSGILTEYVERAKEVAKENEVIICDCYKKWQNMFKNGVDTTNLLANRINHPTKEMHWLFANALADLILY